MQLMPERPMALFSSDSDPEFAAMAEQVQTLIRGLAETQQVSLAGPFEVSVVEGQAHVSPVDAQALEGSCGSAREISALLSNGELPDTYTSGDSLADDPLWAAHLDSSWGF